MQYYDKDFILCKFIFHATIIITNQLGEEVLKTRTNNLKTELDLSHLPKGVYMVQVNTTSGVTTKKITLN